MFLENGNLKHQIYGSYLEWCAQSNNDTVGTHIFLGLYDVTLWHCKDCLVFFFQFQQTTIHDIDTNKQPRLNIIAINQQIPIHVQIFCYDIFSQSNIFAKLAWLLLHTGNVWLIGINCCERCNQNQLSSTFNFYLFSLWMEHILFHMGLQNRTPVKGLDASELFWQLEGDLHNIRLCIC